MNFSVVIRKKEIAYRRADSHEREVLRTRLRLGGNSARCRRRAITCLRKNALFAARILTPLPASANDTGPIV